MAEEISLDIEEAKLNEMKEPIVYPIQKEDEMYSMDVIYLLTKRIFSLEKNIIKDYNILRQNTDHLDQITLNYHELNNQFTLINARVNSIKISNSKSYISLILTLFMSIFNLIIWFKVFS